MLGPRKYGAGPQHISQDNLPGDSGAAGREPHSEENLENLAELWSEISEVILRECLLSNCYVKYNLSLSPMK